MDMPQSRLPENGHSVNPSKVINRGKRFQKPVCDKNALGATGRCSAHSGSRWCQEPGRDKSALGATDRSRAHGEGRRGQVPGCDIGARVRQAAAKPVVKACGTRSQDATRTHGVRQAAA